MTLKELFYKYLDDSMTPEELKLFRELASLKENRLELDQLLREWVDRDFPFAAAEVVDTQAIYSGILERVDLGGGAAVTDEQRSALAADQRQSGLTADQRWSGRRISLTCLIPAAACLLLVFGLHLFYRPVSPSTSIVNAKPASIVPAGNKAVLTLADGRQIVLDSAAEGSLAVQGASQVVKLASGQIAYKTAGRGDANKPMAVSYNTMTTPRGGLYQLTLPDGSRVWLDASSSLTYPVAFTGKQRVVALTGEAYFEIAPDANQPFSVSTGGATVHVLGTEFNMNAYPDEEAVSTTLVSGSVRVASTVRQQEIHPGQQASLLKDGKLSLSTPDLREVLAWKQGQFRFKDQPIRAIMRQVSRWYDVDVKFAGPEPQTKFSGVISRKQDVTELLEALKETGDFSFTIRDRTIIVK